MGSLIQFFPTQRWLWMFDYGLLSSLKKALFTKPVPDAKGVWFRGLRSPAPREMCHLHRALFLELRFAECKGWAGFSRVPGSWEEEEEEGTRLIFCSVLVHGGCCFTTVLW